jgi:hypothetical protein
VRRQPGQHLGARGVVGDGGGGGQRLGHDGEWVWNNVKNDRIGRAVIMSKGDLKARAVSALRRLQKLPDIVRGFFRDAKLAYILELHGDTRTRVYKHIF